MRRDFVAVVTAMFAISLVSGSCFSSAYAQRRPPVENQVPKSSPPAWIEGTVTAKPQADRLRYLVVNGTNFIVMANIRIAELYQSEPGITSERQIDFFQIRKGQRVNIKVEGNRVYEIQIPLR